MMRRESLFPLEGRAILDVGCGIGRQLNEFESWGATRQKLAGIDLDPSRVRRALDRLCSPTGLKSDGADIRVGNAASLPWPDDTFDVVHQSTVFTSIPDQDTKRAVAAEMLRVLKAGGVLIWYDFFYDNPKNPSVRGVEAREVRSLFPACTVTLKRTTLAPPIARRLVPIGWIPAMLLEELRFLNTHYLGIIRKPCEAPAGIQNVSRKVVAMVKSLREDSWVPTGLLDPDRRNPRTQTLRCLASRPPASRRR